MKIDGNVAEWLRRGLQILVSQFDSGRCLQNKLKMILYKKYKKNKSIELILTLNEK